MVSTLVAVAFILSFGQCQAKDKAVVIVIDPSWDDTAGYVEHVPLLKKFKIIKVNTHQGSSFSFAGGHVNLYRELTYSGSKASATESAEELCPQLRELQSEVSMAAVMPTSDPSVHLTDLLAACLGVRGNPSTGLLAHARRDKWAMGEAVRKAGLRSVREKLVYSWAETEAYLKSFAKPVSKQNPVIFKILTGSAGNGVNQIHSMEQAKLVFDEVDQSSKENGVSTKILVQEDLQGKEYAIDSVSRDGVHKVVTVWFEDFRPANGIFDQYYGFKVLDPEEPFTQRLIAYSNKVLDAVGLYNGGANLELKFLEDEDQPCLVEVNARWAGISWNDGLAVEKATTGTDQVAATFDAYLDKDAFESMPAVRPITQWGAVIFTLNWRPGVLRGMPGLDAAKKLPSYIASGEEYANIGKLLPLTTPSSIPVEIALAHPDKSVVDADYARIIATEKANGFFDTVPLQPPFNLATSRLSAATAPMAFGAFMTVAVLFAVLSRRREREDTVYLAIE
jgi:hypothetical protein